MQNDSAFKAPKALKADHANHAFQKWHLGYWLKHYTPTFRGFEKFLGYYNAAMSSYWYHGKEDASCLNQWSTELSNNTGNTIAGVARARRRRDARD